MKPRKTAPPAAKVAVQDHPAGIVLRLRVRPGSRREAISIHGDALRLSVHEPPEKGRANQRVLQLLAQALGVKPGNIQLLSGEASRDKRVLITDMTAERLQEGISRMTTE